MEKSGCVHMAGFVAGEKASNMITCGGASFRAAGWVSKRGEVGQVHVPLDGLRAVLEGAVAVAQEAFQVRFVAAQVTERVAVLEGEGQRFEGVVEAQQVDGAGDGAGRAQGGEGVGGRAEADIPQDEFAGVMLEALDQAQLPDIQGVGFGDRADHGMEGLVVGQGMDAVGAIGELDDSVSGGGRHGGNLEHGTAEAKFKERARAAKHSR